MPSNLPEIAELYHDGVIHRLTALSLLFVLFVTGACSSSASKPAATTPAATAAATVTPVSFGSASVSYLKDGTPAQINVEVASTSAQSERGLGYRDSLAAGTGMLFDLHETRPAQIWMKGMRFPLDLVWIGEDKRVISVTAAVPIEPPSTPDADLPRYASPLPVRYVLELNAGGSARLGIVQDTQLTFELPPVAQP